MYSEKNYRDILIENFESIDQFKFYKSPIAEYLTQYGRIDILAKEGASKCIIELKLGNVNPAEQLIRYSKNFKKAILVAITETPVENKNKDIKYLTFDELTIEGKNIDYLEHYLQKMFVKNIQGRQSFISYSGTESNLANLLEKLEKFPVLLSVKDAAKYLSISRNRFKYYFVDTGVIEPIYLKGQKHPRFSLYDVLQIPDRMKERQEVVRYQERTNPRSVVDLAFKSAMEGL